MQTIPPLAIAVLASAASLVMAAEPVAREPMLEAHNAVRRQHDLPQLDWSARLARDAAAWADRLAERESCTMQHATGRQGENLFWASPLYRSDGERFVQAIAPAEVVAEWAAEQAHYDYATNSCRAEQCGHYTQIVWADTEQVGCARRICPDKAQLWVCRYLPPGNVVGQRPW